MAKEYYCQQNLKKILTKRILRLIVLYFVLSCGLVYSISHSLPHITNGVLLSPIHSDRAVRGDRIEVQIQEAINLPEQRVFIPVNSIISGHVINIQPSQRGMQTGYIQIQFETIHLPNGHIIYTEGYLIQDTTDSQLSQFKNKTKTVLSHANPFRKLNNNNTDDNTLITGNLGWKDKIFRIGKVGTGALLGGPVGAAVATGSLVFDKGGRVSIDKGSIVRIQINQIHISTVEAKLYDSSPSPDYSQYLYKPKPQLNGQNI